MRRICEYCSDKETCSYLKHGHESKCLGVQDYDLGYEEAVEKACKEFKFFLDRIIEKDIEALRPEILQADVKVWYEDFKHIMEERQ